MIDLNQVGQAPACRAFPALNCRIAGDLTTTTTTDLTMEIFSSMRKAGGSLPYGYLFLKGR